MANRNSIYEVFRACRLCGGGGGYKMPIVNMEDELDMRHKIRECVRLEVHQDDKMPPLICELCVDKLNDFYEFLQTCRATDSRTRQKLGLQQANVSHGGSDGGDCILGVTEPVFVNEDSGDEPLARQKNRLVVGGKSKKSSALTKKDEMVPVVSIKRSGPKIMKKELKELRLNMNGAMPEGRRSRSAASAGGRSSRTRRSPTPSPPTTPSRRARDERNVKQESKPLKSSLKSALKPDLKSSREDSLLEERRLGKRRGEERNDRGTRLQLQPAKRVKIITKPQPEKKSEKPRAEKRKASPPPQRDAKKFSVPPASCNLCPATCNKQAQLNQHMRTVHSPMFTPHKLACNPCGEWFTSWDETSAHHRWHKSHAPYSCRRCGADFKQLSGYNKHLVSEQCVPWREVPDVKCDECWATFPTNNLLLQHRCRGADARPGGPCSKCNRKYATHKSLKKHEETCFKPGPKRKGEKVKISPELMRRVLPMQVRMARCDLLLDLKQEEPYDVSRIDKSFGLDKNCVYPYISSVRSIKREPLDIKQEIDFDDSLIEYESYTDSDSEPEFIEEIREGEPKVVVNPFAKKKKSIDALSTLSIKAIFSPRLLGKKKIQRKRKRRPIIKTEVKDETESAEVSKENYDISADVEKNYVDDNDEVRKTVDDLINGLEVDEAEKENNEKENMDRSQIETENIDTVIEKQNSHAENSLKENGDMKQANESEAVDSNVNISKKSDLENQLESTDRNPNISSESQNNATLTNGDLDPNSLENCDSVTVNINQETVKKTSENVSINEESRMEKDSKPSEIDESKILDIESNNKEISNEKTSVAAVINKEQNESEELKSSTQKTEEIIESNTESNIEKSSNAVEEIEFSEQKVNSEVSQENTESKIDDDEFDINSMFSGELSSTALRAQGKPTTDIETKGEDSKITDSVTNEDNVNEINHKLECENGNAKEQLNENPEVPKDKEKNTESVKDETKMLETSSLHSSKSIENTERTETIKESQNTPDNVKNIESCTDSKVETSSENKELKTVTSEIVEKENIKEKTVEKSIEDEFLNEDLENISDTEMDDGELMNEINDQINEKKIEEEKISLDDLLQASAEVNAKEKPEQTDNLDAEFNLDS